MRATQKLARWHSGAEVTSPARTEVHLWRAALDGDSLTRSYYRDILRDDERERAARFRFELHRHRYIVSRAVLRQILSQYVGLPASEIEFVTNAHGKPALLEPTSNLEFNVSHAGGVAVLAFAEGRRVGVDVEDTGRDAEFRRLADRFFSPRERDVFASLPDSQVREEFYACWTRKEAYIKALGLGVTHGLANFTVAFGHGTEPGIVHSEIDPRAAERWGMRTFVPAEGFVGAIVAENGDWALRMYEFGDEP